MVKSAHVQTSDADLTPKLGHGILKAIFVVTASASSTLDVYDGTDATGEVIAEIDTSVTQNLSRICTPFNTGLFLDVTGTGAKVLVLYE